ncbi:MAG: aspartate carbamoyltransferase catalytic subunit [Deltaproteobacteria bacterium]|nr:aspartate carbamoyltransferase catalytic subunit [Deltaproteobacteria bacterium]
MSFLSVRNFTAEQVENLFTDAIFFKTKEAKPKLENKVISLIFFEPSTRTRISFEMAALRLGAKVSLLNGKVGTSLEKDETPEDTIKNIAAMKPDLLVIRANDNVNLNQMINEVSPPIINAGWGTKGHPTQALLDILTIKDSNRNIENEKILFVGDIRHSRVVSSHLELAKILGYKIAFCAPKEMIPENSSQVYFDNLKDGLDWASSVYSLRMQIERHTEKYSLNNISTQFQINNKSLKGWKKDGLILHPGPVNYGIELAEEILIDSRNIILKQVQYGVLIRMALIYHFLKETL